MSDQFSQAIIDKLFEDNPNLLVNHHLDSYNEFFLAGLRGSSGRRILFES